MKLKLLLASFLFITVAASAQYTQIPDINFENKLIALGIDSGTPDGQVLTANVSSLQTLDVSSSAISSLKGIEDFTALTALSCYCNQVTTLDVSKNTALTDLNCSDNNLSSLNVKNGANKNFKAVNFQNNPKLTCIQVDDLTYADANWSAAKDAVAGYDTDCVAFALSAGEIVFKNLTVYSNSTKRELHIDNVNLAKATVYNTTGKMVKTVSFNTGSDKNTMSLNGLTKGVYYVFIDAEGAQKTARIAIE